MFGRNKGEALSDGRLEALKRRSSGAPALQPAAPAPAAAPDSAAISEAPAPQSAPEPPPTTGLDEIRPQLSKRVLTRIGTQAALSQPRKEIARLVTDIVGEFLAEHKIAIPVLESRGLVTNLINEVIAEAKSRTAVRPGAGSAPSPQPDRAPNLSKALAELSSAPVAPSAPPARTASRASVEEAALRIQSVIMDRIDVAAASRLPRAEIAQQIQGVVAEILTEQKIQLNALEQRDLVTKLLNEMLGLGPLEPLLADETITDIMVNGAKQIYIERRGKLELTDVAFRDDAHVMNVATRIVTAIGRRVDESSPLVDARLQDGSRVNIIIPPLAIDGPSISIRKFSKKGITLDVMARQGNISEQMATVLKIAARARLNILISGGTGSGKTTLLNALSQLIDPGERIVTIEDAAELQLQQPHVVRLETRPANLEGDGEINMRDLVKNSLRMRPDRIILGEVRGSEAVDMLQAMNTGHEGSLGTIHANRPREALTRLENMIGLAGINLPAKAVRTQIAAAIDMIVQVSRMRDGMRRVTNIMEIVGMEGDVITTQELFTYEFEGEGTDGMLRGTFKSSGLRPNFTPKAEYFGLDRALLEAL
jgi:pilus assembly protein CpaF